MKGIYAYVDTMDNSVVYIGKDSYIDKGKRRRDHIQPSNYNKQPFNRVLQNNLNRYEYKEVFVFDDITDTELNQLEMQQIALFNPKFNFTKGGEGCTGYKHSLASRRKISEGQKGSIPWNKGKTNVYSEETRLKMSEARKGKKHSEETKKKMSMARTKKYPRINKGGFQNGKRVYNLYFEGKTLKSSICREKLEIELNKMLEELE